MGELTVSKLNNNLTMVKTIPWRIAEVEYQERRSKLFFSFDQKRGHSLMRHNITRKRKEQDEDIRMGVMTQWE